MLVPLWRLVSDPCCVRYKSCNSFCGSFSHTNEERVFFILLLHTREDGSVDDVAVAGGRQEHAEHAGSVREEAAAHREAAQQATVQVSACKSS